jgi:ubiquinone/menaquinone biosynthesis C-methylase UbiE
VKRTNYEDVAARYDQNAKRHQIPTDELLAPLVTARAPGAPPLEALDLGCGTGNYLSVQTAAFGDRVRWRGLDASEAMLARARTKVGTQVELVIGRAEALPYADATFDYLTTSFAFHHFEDKPRALDEMRRVMKPGAAFRLFNIEPTRMKGWWVYDLFPEAWLEDQKRFWSAELFHHELEQRGFDARVRAALAADAQGSWISEIALIHVTAQLRP